MSTSSAASFGLKAGPSRRPVSSKQSGGMILAGALFLCGCRTLSGLLVKATGFASAPRQLADDGGSTTYGGDDGFPVVHGRGFLGDGHQEKKSSFPVLPGVWMDGEVGRCHPASGIYTWRKWGFGSNINQLLLTWVEGIYEGQTDLALDMTGNPNVHLGYSLKGVKCQSGAPDAEQHLSGWSCFFKPMRHLCVLHHEEELNEFLSVKENVELQPEAPLIHLSANVSDNVAVPAALMDFIYSHLQPWFKADMRAILEEDELVSMRDGKFVAIHVRRGDKILGEAKKVEVQEYFKAAVSAIEQASSSQVGIESITGVWVSSDDATVLQEARDMAATFFPNVRPDNVISISFRSVRNEADTIPTWTTRMAYDAYVVLHTELAMMSAADLFVGTFSSNLARLLYLVREGLGFSRNSTISVDDPEWYPGRRARA